MSDSHWLLGLIWESHLTDWDRHQRPGIVEVSFCLDYAGCFFDSLHPLFKFD